MRIVGKNYDEIVREKKKDNGGLKRR